MNKKELQKFRSILLKEQDRLTQRVANRSSSNADPDAKSRSGYGIHMAETGNEEEEFEKNLMFLSQEGDTLSLIEGSLKKIDSGTYGICERCGETIPTARLVAKPFARYCIDCRIKEERRL